MSRSYSDHCELEGYGDCAADQNDAHEFDMWSFMQAARAMAEAHGYTASDLAAKVEEALRPEPTRAPAPIGNDPVPF